MAQNPFDQFDAPVAPTAQPTPEAESYRAGLESLVNAGAGPDQIHSYIVAHGIDPNQVQGLNEAIAAVKAGHKVRIPVNLTGVAPSQPPAKNDPAPSDENPFDQFDQHPHTNLDEVNLGIRHIMDGAVGIGDLINMPVNILDNTIRSAIGMPARPTMTQQANQAWDALGLPQDQTDGERLAGKFVEGATGGMLTGGESAAPMIAAALSGGGAGSASELARQNGAGTGLQLAAGLAGGLVAPGTMAAGGRLAGAFAPAAERELTPVAQAFADQKVPALPADVGGTGARGMTAAINTTLGGIPLRKAAEASIAAARAAQDRIAGKIGTVGNDLTAGQAAQSGAQSFLDRTAKTGGSFFDAIPIPGERVASLSNSKAALADLTEGLQSNPDLSAVMSDPRMARIADAVQGKVVKEPTGILDASGNSIMRDVQKGGVLSWQDLKDFRSYVGEKAGAQALQSDTPQRNLKALYGALSDDMQATAAAEGKPALAAFQRANTYWRARQQRISDVIIPILGKDGNNTAEQAFRTIQQWAGNKGSFASTAQALRSLPEDEANTVRASIFGKMGTARAGSQDATGDVFSSSEFMTNWNNIPKNAKSVLFPGEQYQKDINDLVTIANAQKLAVKFANTSGTANAIHGAAAAGQFGALVLSTVFGHLTAGASIAGELGAQYGAGKLLASPAVARWLASSVKKPNAAAQLAHINRLTAIAAKQPAIANDILNLQEKLASHFTGSVNPFAGPQPIAAQTQGTQQ